MIESSRIYIDANPFIYAIEGDKALARAMMDLFSLLRQRSGVGVTSELTLAEVLAKAKPPAESLG
jgi:predicted nucleic acid-binding protein